MTELWTIILTVVVSTLIIYYYGFWNLNYFKKRGIPYIPPLPLLGNMGHNLFRKRTLIETALHAYNFNRDAKYIGFFDFSSPVIFVRDPELIKLITIKYAENFPDHKMLAEEVPDSLFAKSLFGLKGQLWRDTRVVLSPAFTASKMKILFKLIKECSANLIKHLEARTTEPTIFDLRDLLSRYTNDVILTSAFGISVDSLKDPQNEFFLMGKQATDFTGARSLRLFLLRTFPLMSKLFGVKLYNDKIANFYKHIIKTTLTTRTQKGIVRPDMLQLMMQAREKSKHMELSDDDMTAHAFIFYFGGFDTASLLMCFCIHKLATHPEIYRKLQAEIDEVVEQCAGDVTYEALHAMQYLDAVINETLRLHGPATIGDRICRKELELPPTLPGSKPFIVEPGVSVWFAFDAIHKDSKYFSNPEKFDPDRFTEANKHSIDPATFLPFGSGPRFCVGNRFALMETKLSIFELMANFEISPCAKTVNPLEINKSSFIPAIKGGVWLEVKPRSR